MMRLAAIAMLALFVSSPTWGQSTDEAKKQLIQLQHEWAIARVKGDVPFLERLYAKEFRITSINGSLVERDADIAAFATGAIKPEYVTNEDMWVQVYGDVAVVRGRENVQGTAFGKFGKFTMRFMNVFVRRDGHWQLVAHQTTEIRDKRPG